MIAEEPIVRFEDLEDGPVSLGKKDDGKVPQYSWKDGRFVMVPMPKERKGTGVGIAAFSPGGPGGTSTIAGATDFNDTTGPSTDGYSIVWDDTANKFILSEITGGASTIAGATDFTDTTGPATDGYLFSWDDTAGKFVLIDPSTVGVTDHGALTGLADDDHTQYLLADGSRTGATSSRQEFTNGLTTGSIRPATDSTTALELQTLGGTPVLTVDTTNRRASIYNATSSGQLLIGSGATGNANLLLDASNGDGIGSDYYLFRHTRSGNRFTALYGDGTVILDGYSNGRVAIGGSHLPRTFVDAAASTALVASFRMNEGISPNSPFDGSAWKLADAFVLYGKEATTNAIVDTLTLRRDSTGTPSAGFGSAMNTQLKSSTTVGRDAGSIKYSWISSTDATRTSRADFSTYYTTTERTSLSIGSDSSESLLSFHDAALAAKPDITGSRGGNAALADLLAKLATIGLITDSTT